MSFTDACGRPSHAPALPYRSMCCFIVPPGVLKKYARDGAIDAATRKSLQDTYVETERLRGLREAHRIATLRDADRFLAGAAVHLPAQHLFDCVHRKGLPGKAVAAPAGAFKTVFDTTAKVVEFYKTVLGRNSVDTRASTCRPACTTPRTTTTRSGTVRRWCTATATASCSARCTCRPTSSATS
jgi:hypothetical protein